MTRRIFYAVFILSTTLFCAGPAVAQFDKITIDLQKDKPEKFQTRKLRSEKTGEKKLTVLGKFYQNNVSYYNYHFNAQTKLDAVIENARLAQKDDYTKLLPYYSYSLDNTATQSVELDSVVQKATAGILLHDLRTDWVDNFYLQIGQAYYLAGKFDSAYMAFQFINFNLAPKNKKDKNSSNLVGSNENAQSGAMSIANKEDRNVLQKVFSQPPSRNDALAWQIRTLTEMEQYAEAAGLINTLKNDPNLPDRLVPYLNELQGYWFYKNEMYDSALRYLELGLPNSIDLQDKARREFLLAQLYENSESLDTAYGYYTLAIKHTTDPLMDIYANLNRAKLLYSDDVQEIRNSIGHLLKMAKRDKYHDYRHIIFLAAGELAMDIPDTLSALQFYDRSAFFNQNDFNLKNQAFLELADLSYARADYVNAYNYYDSLRPSENNELYDLETIGIKKAALAQIIKDIFIIDREDSLQMIAAMPEAEREAFLKKLSKKLKKERGVPDEEYYSGGASDPFKNKDGSVDLFANNNSAKGAWYFYNTNLKSKGYNEFKKEWGNRQNIDNWRRVSLQGPSSLKNMADRPGMGMGGDPMEATPQNTGAQTENFGMPEPTDLSVDGLRENLPLTPADLDSSNQKIAKALYSLANNYQSLLEDYQAAANTYEISLQEFPDSLYRGELYMNLSYCYKQLGNHIMADKYIKLLTKGFPDSEFTDYVLHPEKFAPKKEDSVGTNTYNDIYLTFIEGLFDKALHDKKAADSIYGKTHWTPQLLYIESVYHIQQREDSVALELLNNILKEYPESEMNDKVQSLVRVLKKRATIEEFLTNLEIERLPEDSQIVVYENTRIYGNVPEKLVRDDSNLLPRKITTVDVPEIRDDKKAPAVKRLENFVFDPLSEQNIMLVMTKVDPVYISETRNALNNYCKTKFRKHKIEVTRDTIDADRAVLLFSGFVSAEDAVTVMDQIKKDMRREVSWLPADKYFFWIISDENFELLKETKKTDSYLDLLRENIPDKF